MSVRRHRSSKTFIVKVQTSLFNSKGVSLMLVYNEDQTHWFQGQASEDVLSFGEPKSFWWARINKQKQIELLEPAPWQEW